MSKPKSEEELKKSERVLRQFLSDLEGQIKNDPSMKGKKADFNNNLVSIPSSVRKPDPKTGAPVHIITKSQVPLFYQLVHNIDGTEEESSKPEDNLQNYQPYRSSTESKTTKKEQPASNTPKKEPVRITQFKRSPLKKVEVLPGPDESAKATEEKEKKAKEDEMRANMKAEEERERKAREDELKVQDEKTRTQEEKERKAREDELKAHEEIRTQEEKERKAREDALKAEEERMQTKEENERKAQERKNICIEHCKADLDSKLKTFTQKTKSEEEIEINVQSLLEKYKVSQICADLKKIEKKNTRRDMLLKRAEICKLECDKPEPIESDKRNKGGSEFEGNSKESPPIFIPSEYRRIIQCHPNKLHFFLYK